MWKKRLTSSLIALSMLLSGAPAMALSPDAGQGGTAGQEDNTEWATPRVVSDRSARSTIEQGGQRPAVPGNVNLAYKANVTTSTYRAYSDTYYFYGANAVDGSQDTGWMSRIPNPKKPAEVGAPTETLVLDLGETQDFNQLSLSFNAVKTGDGNYCISLAGRPFTLQTSMNGSDWTDLVSSVSAGTGIIYDKPDADSYFDFSFDAVSARYVRFEMTKQDAQTEAAYIWELALYNEQEDHALDVGAAEVFDLHIPKYVSRDFTVPVITSAGAAVAWAGSNAALTIDAQGKVQVKPVAAETNVTLTATITKNGVTGNRVLAFDLTLRPEADQLIDYQIFPEPQRITRGGSSVQIANTVTLIGGAGVSAQTLARVKDVFTSHGMTVNPSASPVAGTTNVDLSIYGPANTTDYALYADTAVAKAEGGKKNEPNVFDAHIIDIKGESGDARIKVVGKHDDAVYYAAATLDQMLDQMQDGNKLSDVLIEDYANTKWRGIVEGFYGQPYTAADIESLMEFGQKYKMNTFIYGPKADPYHASLWKEAYPTEATITAEQRKNGVHTQEELRHIAQVADKTHVNFVWSIHPMMDPKTRIDITKPEKIDQGVQDILNKFRMMRELGIKGFGMFVDDVDTGAVSVLPGASEMARMIGNVTSGWKAIAGDEFRPVFYVPSLYCMASYWPLYHVATHIKPLGKLPNLDDIVLTFTGSSVFTPITNDGFDAFTNSLGAGEDYKWNLWWNSPVNDGSDGSLFIGPADQRYDMLNNVTNGSGIISNPMQQAEVSKVQLFGILDYAWNTGAFDSQKSWEASFEGIFGDDEEVREAYRVFAMNSAPAEATDGSLKPSVAYSGLEQTAKAVLENPTEQNIQDLYTDIADWYSACLTLQETLPASENPEYRALYTEIEPWLNKSMVQMDYLVACLEAYQGNADYANIDFYLQLENLYASLNSNALFKVHTLEGTGASASDNRVVVTIGGESLNKLLPVALDLASQKISKVIASAGTPGVTLSQSDAGWTLGGMNGKSINAGEYIGALLNGFHALNLGAVASLPAGVELQYTTNQRQWYKYDPTEAKTLIAGVRLMNKTGAPIALPESVMLPFFEKALAQSVTTMVGKYEGKPEYVSDGDWKTLYWSNESPAAGKTFTLDYGDGVAMKNLQLVFDAGDKIDAEVAVELSEDGTAYTQVATLNGKGADAVPPAVVKNDGKNYQVFSVDNLNHMVKSVRLTFVTDNGPWVKFCEITPNAVVPQTTFAESGVSVNAVRDGYLNTMFVPESGKADAITYYALGEKAVGEFQIAMETGSALPTVQVLSGKSWVDASMAMGNDGYYVVDVSKMSDVEALRLSWSADNTPKSISEIGFETKSGGGDSGGGSGGGGGGGGGGTGGTTTPPVTSTDPTTATATVTTKTDENGKATATVSTSSVTDAIAKAKADAAKAGTSANGVLIELKAGADSSTKELELTLPKDALAALAGDSAVKGVTVSSIAGMQLDAAALAQVKQQANGADIIIKIQKSSTSSTQAKALVGDRPVFELSILHGDAKITDLGSGQIEISLPYTLASGETADKVCVVYIDGDGKPSVVSGSHYDATAKAAKAKVNHLSVFAVGYQQTKFTDISGHWAESHINTVVAAGLFNGTSATAFSPDASMTRGMFVTALGRLAESDMSAYTASSFTDVKAGSYYLPYIEWASKNGIVKGVGEGLFAPDRSITREEMATMIASYAAVQKVSLTEKNAAAAFTDAALISAWAADAVSKVQKAGVIEGYPDGRFAPKGTATRAEVSAVFARLLEII